MAAYDRVAGRAAQDPDAYFQAAIETVSANKRRYAEAEAQAGARPPSPLGILAADGA